MLGGLCGTCAESFAHTVRSGLCEEPAGPRLSHGAQGTDGERRAKDASVMVVNAVTEAGIAGLVETFELVEANGVTVGHDETVKEHGETGIAEDLHLSSFPENSGARGKEQMLAVMRISVRGQETFDRA